MDDKIYTNPSSDGFKEIPEKIQEKIDDTKIPDIQKNLMEKPTFQSPGTTTPSPVAAAPTPESNNLGSVSPKTPGINPNLQTSTPKPQMNNNQGFGVVTPNAPQNPTPPTPSNSIAWVFGGLVTFILLALLLGFSYMLSQNDGKALSQLGISPSNVPGIVQGLNAIFLTLGIGFLIVLLVSGAIYSTPGNQRKRKGLSALIFSGCFFVLTLMFYIPAFNLLNNIETSNLGQSLVSVSPSPPIGSAPFEVSFDGSRITQSQGPEFFFNWDFGDGTSPGNGSRVRHTYEKTGTFKVSLVISDGTGKLQEIPTNTIVIVNNAKAQPKIKVDKELGEAPFTVNFDGSESTDSNGSISEFHWEFGDPSSAVNERTGVSVSHTFEKAGVYEVTLTIVDNNSERISTKQSIEVQEKNSGILPKISITPLSGEAPLKVDLNASGSTHSQTGRSITKYTWDFGDGSDIGKTKITQHTYQKIGTYLVTLQLEDDQGNTAQTTAEISVTGASEAPTATITTAPLDLVGPAPFKVTFNGNTSEDPDGSITDYEWKIVGGTDIEHSESFVHEFTQAGEYIVSLTVTDNDDKKSTSTVTVKTTAPGPQAPVAKVKTSPNPAQGIRPLSMNFDASESFDIDGDIISYQWNFGDDTPDSQTSVPTVAHQFDRVGIWRTKLTVYDNTGMTDDFEVTIAVNSARPNAQITSNIRTGVAPLTINFSGLSSTGQITDYRWVYGDGSTDRGDEVTHVYQNSGTYLVKLTVNDNVGQSDTEQITITVQ